VLSETQTAGESSAFYCNLISWPSSLGNLGMCSVYL